MRKILMIILFFLSACSSDNTSNVPNLIAVTYRETSGTISPSKVWDEEYSISSDGISFRRSGFSSLTSVNVGTWTISGYSTNQTELFTDLSGAAVYSVVKTGQDIVSTGGAIKIYELRYDNGERKEVIIGDGSKYNHSEVITTPIDEFISKIILPGNASKRYQSVQNGGAIQGNPLTLSSVVSTVAGSVEGFSDGIGTAAAFNSPYGITTDGTNLYVADSGNHILRKIVIATGEVSTIAGHKGFCGSSDGIGTDAFFCKPTGITTDGINLYVTDTLNSKIRKINVSSGEVTTFSSQAGLSMPYGITTDGINLYVADTYSNTIKRIDISSGSVSTLAGSAGVAGSSDGIGTAALFGRPEALTTDGTYLYVADTYNYTVRKILISTGEVTTLAGTASNVGSSDGVGSAASFWATGGITTDGTNVYVTDTPHGTIRKIVISSAVVTTLAGSNSCINTKDGTGIDACFNYPRGITTDGTNLYINDNNGNLVRKMQ